LVHPIAKQIERKWIARVFFATRAAYFSCVSLFALLRVLGALAFLWLASLACAGGECPLFAKKKKANKKKRKDAFRLPRWARAAMDVPLLLDLPDELLAAIIAATDDVQSVVALGRACRRLHLLAEDGAVWKRLCRGLRGGRGPLHARFASFGKDWKWLYRAHLPASRAERKRRVRSVGMTDDGQGETYAGEFCGVRRHGYGLVHKRGRSVYEGQWKCGEACGRGVMALIDDTLVRGTWKAGALVSGYGREGWPDGILFRGYYKDGMRDGRGLCIWPSGAPIILSSTMATFDAT
jgi:hypothetical protein